MMACTSPGFTVSVSPWRISRSSTRTCRFLTSSNAVIRFSNNLSNGPFQPHAPSVFHAHMHTKMIVETATTIIGGGKIDDDFSRRSINKTQIKTTEANTPTSVCPSQVLGTAPYPFSFGVNQNSFTTNQP